MKQLILFICGFLPLLATAQNVGINTDGTQPDNSAILDVKSDSKGLLLPRLSKAQRTGIATPAIGLTVFDTDSYSFWIFRGDLNGGWVELQHSLQNFWTKSGIHVYNTNNGNVGIGTNTPASKLTIYWTNPVIGIMNNGLANSFIQANGVNMQIGTAPDNATGKIILGTKGTEQFSIDHVGRVSIGTSSSFDAEMKLNGVSPRFAFLNNDVQKGYIRLGGDDFKMGTYPGNSGRIIFSPKGTDRIWIDENGLMGIGTATPASELTINGSNPYIQIQHNNVNKGFLQAVGDHLKIGTNSTNLNGNLVLQTKLLDRMLIDENGNVGIGTASPSSVLTVNGSNPIFQLRNSNIDKGFVQVSGDDLKIGTNATNSNGRFIVRTNGSDRFFIDDDGSTIIGNGIEGGIILDADNPYIYIKSGGLTQGSLTFDNGNDNMVLQKTLFGNGHLIISGNQQAGSSIHLSENGQFNFGTGLFPNGYRMSVEGKVLATDFTTLAVANWPDYVFEKNYQLAPLSEIRKYIAEHKHLPNIPAAAEMEKNGIQLGEMSRKLMEKVEELTLYVLQLQEQIDELKKQAAPTVRQ